MLAENGFTGGNILEPAMGTGNMFGTMPAEISDNSKLYGVELDDVSGRISKQLYQNADIQITGFEKTKFMNESIDLVISNVPFDSVHVNDLEQTENRKNGIALKSDEIDKSKLTLNDYFIEKALDKTKPNGIVAVITSKGTLDKKDSSIRRDIAKKAELAGAVRLPNTAFKANAGTEVTADILIFRKREKALEIEPDWVYRGLNADGLAINQYFIDNPDMVLGKIVAGNKLYGSDDDTSCIPFENFDLREQLRKALSKINIDIKQTEIISDILPDKAKLSEIPANTKPFSYVLTDGKLYFRDNQAMQPYSGAKTAEPRIKGMIEIRDCLRSLITAQLNGKSDSRIEQLQGLLNDLYNKFTEKHGFINSKENQRAFKDDISLPLLSSLEIIKNGKVIDRASIFSKRTINPKKEITSVDTSAEALAVSISEKAKIDIDYMAQLTGFGPEKILADLKGVVYENPMKLDSENKPHLEMADEYLSGNIREKLEHMKEVYSNNPDYALNIEALETVMPKPLEAADIKWRLGSPVFTTQDIESFMYELLNTPKYLQNSSGISNGRICVENSPHTAEWNISNKKSDYSNIAANSAFGTTRRNAYQLIEDCLNQRMTVVKDAVERDGKTVYVTNQAETELAQEKQKEIQSALQEWVLTGKSEIREKLVDRYNVMYNSTRPREFDGSFLQFPGMNSEIKLREHQKNAIAHALYGGNTLFAHEVGAGKTFEIIATAMEGKRLGIHNKSLIAVPNHLTEQLAADFIKLYPNANILVAKASDFEKKNRKKLFAKIATGDFDAVIIGHSQLLKIPVSIERQEKLLRQQIDETVESIALLKMKKSESFNISQLEATRKALEVKLKNLLESPVRDDEITFEELGVDKLFVDEAHLFKNLFLSTKMRNVSGISTNDNVQKTADLFMKCQYLDEITGGKGVIFSTGTPISNSLSEIYTMMRYLQYDRLKELNLVHFDAWASIFAETKTESQLTPEGNGYQMKTRFARFNNVTELMNIFKECADIKTADMLNLPVPECEMTTIVAKPTETQQDLIQGLADRAEKIRKKQVNNDVDNMLNITIDGRKIGLDQRLINPDLPDQPGTKINLCIDNVYRIWNETAENKSTQLIFCDLAVPQTKADIKNKGVRFCAYDDIKNKLVEKGVPPEQIAFIHDAKNETEKDLLFSKVRSGDIRVLIGSTEKMGAGTNVQDRLIASHDLDAPWKPSDLEQRKGRMVRQGNSNEKVFLYRYVTEGTFDAYNYQLLENKQVMAKQIMTSKSPVRSCEDVDESALDLATIKALCTGNPLIKERMDLEIEVTKLSRLKSNHQNTQFRLENEVAQKLPPLIESAKKRIEGIKIDMKHLESMPLSVDEKGETVFSGMTVKGKKFTEKTDAGDALLEAVRSTAIGGKNSIAEYKGFKISAQFDAFGKQFVGNISGASDYRVEFGSSPTGNITRIDNVINAISGELSKTEKALENFEVQLNTAKKQLGQPFVHEQDLRVKQARLTEIIRELEKDSTSEITKPEIHDAQFMEVKADMIPILEKNGLNFEHTETDGRTIIKFDKADSDRLTDIIELSKKSQNQAKPKL